MSKSLEENEYFKKEIIEIRDYLVSVIDKDDLYIMESAFEQMEEFVDVGECELAFEDLCCIIKEANVVMPLRFKQKIFTLATLMDIKEEYWDDIQYSEE